MNEEERKTRTATREDTDKILDLLHVYKHHFVDTHADLDRRVTKLELYAKALMGGVGLTLAGIVALAFWFGSLKATLMDTSARTDKVYEVVLESKDSLKERTSVIETELKALNKNLENLTAPRQGTKPNRRVSATTFANHRKGSH
jgi:hypothetical protein